MGVVRGIDKFEGRSSFKTWLFRILVNRTRSAGAREFTTVPIEDAHAVDPGPVSIRGLPRCVPQLQRVPRADSGDHRVDGTVEPGDLTTETRADITELYRRWRAE
jgi:DNA-directed RNA polymerase specialized sigma24 family protein